MNPSTTFPGIGVIALLAAADGGCGAGEVGDVADEGLYGIPVTALDGRVTSLAEYRGKAMLIVNAASRCGFTSQYAGLQALFERYRDRGLIVLGFPSNDFLRQEPGTNEEIRQFCTLNYGVTFPMYAKLSVKGKDQHPLYAFLTGKDTNPEFSGRITWNFNKFLVGRDGRVVARFGSRVKPESPKMIQAVEAALGPSPR